MLGTHIDLLEDIMIISLLKITSLSKKRDAVFDILQSVIDCTRGLPGCLGSTYYEEGKKEGTVLYVEKWATKEALHRHIRSDLYQRLISVMELAVESPEIRFHEVSQSMGMELVETLRSDISVPDCLLGREVS
jgi:quinol monooxygenase YgiN